MPLMRITSRRCRPCGLSVLWDGTILLELLFEESYLFSHGDSKEMVSHIGWPADIEVKEDSEPSLEELVKLGCPLAKALAV